jgi:hypothetical protein
MGWNHRGDRVSRTMRVRTRGTLALLAAVVVAGVGVPPAQGSDGGLAHKSVTGVVDSLVKAPPPNFRPDIMATAKILSKRGPDETIDLTKLEPALPSFLPWTGCSGVPEGVICWGKIIAETVEAGEFDTCADGRTIHQNSSEDKFFVRLYGNDGRLLFRGTDHSFDYFNLSFSPDATGIVLSDRSVFNMQLWMDEPGVISGTTTYSGVVDYAVSAKGNLIIAGYGLRQEDPDFQTVSAYQVGRWDLWDDYDATIARICGALDGAV